MSALLSQFSLGLVHSKRRSSDRLFTLTAEDMQVLPTVVDMRKDMPPVYDQGKLGSCVDNAVAAALEYAWIREKLGDPFVPSRLFQYFNARDIEGNTAVDGGSTIRDGVLAVAQKGFCPETLWPYDISKFAVKPSDEVYQAAKKDILEDYGYVPKTVLHVRQTLAAGFPVVLGFVVCKSFYTEKCLKQGIIPVPNLDTDEVLGGHGILLVGYNDVHKWFIMRNSWGDQVGDKGYFYMPYEMVADPDISEDPWTLRVVKTTGDSKLLAA